MKQETFDTQMARLKSRFGDKAFDAEIERLIGLETSVMTDEAFTGLINSFIGDRKFHDPPLLRDFREARINFEQRSLHNTVTMVARGMKHDESLNNYLKEMGAKSAMDAVNKIKGKGA